MINFQVQIPPTEVGNSHIEVTLDIDADTVVNVSARNKVTGKEQHSKYMLRFVVIRGSIFRSVYMTIFVKKDDLCQYL